MKEHSLGAAFVSFFCAVEAGKLLCRPEPGPSCALGLFLGGGLSLCPAPSGGEAGVERIPPEALF